MVWTSALTPALSHPMGEGELAPAPLVDYGDRYVMVRGSKREFHFGEFPLTGEGETLERF